MILDDDTILYKPTLENLEFWQRHGVVQDSGAPKSSRGPMAAGGQLHCGNPLLTLQRQLLVPGWWNGSSPRTSRSVRDVLMGVKMKTRWVCMKVEHPIIMFSCYKKRQRLDKTQFYRTSSHQPGYSNTSELNIEKWQKDQHHTHRPKKLRASATHPLSLTASSCHLGWCKLL